MQDGDLIHYLAEQHSKLLQKQAAAVGSAAADVVKRLNDAIGDGQTEEVVDKVAEEAPDFVSEDFLMAAVLTYADAMSARSGNAN